MGKAEYVIVSRDIQLPEYDELWVVDFGSGREDLPYVIEGPIYIADSDELDIIDYFGEELGKKIWDAYDRGEIVALGRRKALQVLEAIDDYYEFHSYGRRSNYAKRASRYVVYKLKV